MTTSSGNLVEDAQDWEAGWWGDCINTFGEEAKQISYAHRMGLLVVPDYGRWPMYDLAEASILDLGGGPVSMLLKTRNKGKHCTVVDPCAYPEWIATRYEVAGIEYVREEAETFQSGIEFSEAWCYNVLQHVVDPESVIATAKTHASRLRIFEWLETEACDGHPHTLRADDLNKWIGKGSGVIEMVNENGAYGLAFYGNFDLR